GRLVFAVARTGEAQSGIESGAHPGGRGQLPTRPGSPATSAGSEPREAGMSESLSATLSPAEKVKNFPTTPGLYLMKDAQGRVIYIGKAKNLRSRAGSYFHKTAAGDRRICRWIAEVVDIDFLAADCDVDVLLLDACLI